MRLTLPTATGFSGPGASSGVLPSSRRCLSRRRFEDPRKRGHGTARLRSAKVWLGGKRVKVRRRAGRLRARSSTSGGATSSGSGCGSSRRRAAAGRCATSAPTTLHAEEAKEAVALSGEQPPHEPLESLERPTLDRAEHDRAVRVAFGNELESGHVVMVIGESHAHLKIAYESYVLGACAVDHAGTPRSWLKPLPGGAARATARRRRPRTSQSEPGWARSSARCASSRKTI